MSDEAKPVVVGVDESLASRGALWWAVREARMRHSRLLVVHSMTVADAAAERAQAVAEEAFALARALAPDLSVDMVVDDQPAGRALCRLSRDATLVVVASRGLGGFTGLLLGSVSAHVATHAESPVLVVHGGERWAGPEELDGSTLPVVAGIGPYGRSASALEPLLDFAFAEAHLRGVELLALRAWNPPLPPWRSDARPLVADVAGLETSERIDLTDAVRPYRHKYPDVTVRQRVAPVGAAAALIDAAAHAQLVVVGAHHGRAAGLRLGSVSQQVLHHAPSPVALVPSGAVDRSEHPGGAS
jgi:nucleotide-binding universal stress UspA family protein